MNDKKLVNLVESTNRELQEKELNLIKKHLIREIRELKESYRKIEESLVKRGLLTEARGLAGRLHGSAPEGNEKEFFRLIAKLKNMNPQSPEYANLKQRIQNIGSRMGAGSSLISDIGDDSDIDPKAADYTSQGGGGFSPGTSIKANRMDYVKRIAAKTDKSKLRDKPVALMTPEELKDHVNTLDLDGLEKAAGEVSSKRQSEIIMNAMEERKKQRDEYLGAMGGEKSI